MNIDELERLEQAATAGPWYTNGMGYGAEHGTEYEVSTEGGAGIWTAHCQVPADAAFIAAARNALPVLLRVARAAQALYAEWDRPVGETPREYTMAWQDMVTRRDEELRAALAALEATP